MAFFSMRATASVHGWHAFYPPMFPSLSIKVDLYKLGTYKQVGRFESRAVHMINTIILQYARESINKAMLVY